jgi:predicted nucleic-acid-binding Zn-ribbon protein
MPVFKFPLVAGKWYILIACKKCEVTQVLFPDLTSGKARLDATYGWTCPSCGHHAYYDSDDLTRYQHPDKPK